MNLASPYKGLDAFGDSDLDALLFFGREREREIVVANLIAARLTVLYGPTGVGKSSLLRAGVARTLRELPESPVVVVFDRWSDDPSSDLAEVVAETVGEEVGGGLVEVVERAQRDRDVYLILDQAEEYFVYQDEDSGFDVELARLVGDPLRVNVLLSLREDSLARLDRFKPRIPAVYANSLRLDRLDREAGRIAIVRPVERWNELEREHVEVEPALVESVLDGVRAGDLAQTGGLGAVDGNGRATSIEAPYLQLVMQRVWDVERAEDSRALRAGTLTELGGARRVVADHLERAIAELTPPERDVAARLFTYLVTPSGTKIAHALPDLAEYAGVPQEDAGPVVETLSRHRILRPDEAGRTEIFHDVLAAEVLGWRRAHEAVRALERERAEARRRHRRLAWLAGLAVGALLLTTALAVFAFSQRGEARRQATKAHRQELVARRKTAETKASQAKTRRLLKENVGKTREVERANRKLRARTRQLKETNVKLRDETRRANDKTAEAQRQSDVARAQKTRADAKSKVAQEKTAEAASETEVARRQTRLATARALRDRARALQGVNPTKSLRLALRAARLEPNADAEDTLRSSLVAMRERHVLPAGGRVVRTAAFDPTGSLILVASSSGARLFDADAAKLVRVLDPRRVWQAAFSHDGRLIATADDDGKARLWRVGSGDLVRTLTHAGSVRAVSFSRDDRLLVTAGTDWTARVWDTDSGALIATLRHDAPVSAATFSPDARRVVTVSGPPPGKTAPVVAQIYDAQSGSRLDSLPQGRVTSAKFSPDGTLVVTTSADRSARLWDARTGNELSRLEQPSGHVVDAEFNSDSTRLVLATDSGAGFVWDARDPANPERLFSLVGPTSALTSASYSPDGGLVVVASRDKTARVYLANSGLQLASLIGHDEAVVGAAFSRDGNAILTAGADGTARIWSPPASTELQLVGSHDAGSSVSVVRLSPDGRTALSAGSDGTARLWRVGSRHEVGVLRGHTGAVLDAEFNPDGRLVVTAGADGTARIWTLADARAIRVLDHGGSVTRALFSPDGRLVATASEDGTAALWRLDDGARLATLRHDGAVTDLGFSPDGKLLVTASTDHVARLWSVPRGRLLHELKGHRGAVRRVSFSPDGRLVLTASDDHTARLWRVRDGGRFHLLARHTGAVTDAEFSLNGKLVVTASVDRDVRIWSVASGSSLHTLRGHASAVRTASFSPDGRWVVTGAHTSAGLWEVSTGRGFSVSLPGFPFLRGHDDWITTASFAPDSRRIVTGSLDGTVRTYVCELCGRLPSLVAIARGRLAELQRQANRKRRA